MTSKNRNGAARRNPRGWRGIMAIRYAGSGSVSSRIRFLGEPKTPSSPPP
jgi:hypothetical protein